MDYQGIKTAYAGLCLLGELRQRGVGRAAALLLNSFGHSAPAFAERYAGLFSSSLDAGGLSGALLRELLRTDNPFARQSRARSFEALDEPLRRAAEHDAKVLCALWDFLQPERLRAAAAECFPESAAELLALPEYDSGFPFPLSGAAELYAYYRKNGFGRFAAAAVFRRRNGAYEALAHPDPVRLRDLKRYERQKQIILDNTRLLLSGNRANNLLLYGDRGTGKSSTVKAVANEFAAEGLKLIELAKEDIPDFPALCAELADSPFRFIVFLDDLTFSRAEDSAPLKAALEGGASKTPDNLAVYATSNRRHLTQERFSDREGDDIHVRDTIESLCSLSDRFGIEVVFESPGQDEYHDIVLQLAQDRGIDLDADSLCRLADRFALRRGVRSPRTAGQFITSLFAGETKSVL